MADAVTPYRPPRFIAALDVGQMNDPAALVVLERQMRLCYGQLEPYFFAGHLERIDLQTPYPAMARGVRQRLERIGERCVLVIDATGVGRGVVDLFREEWTDYDAFTMVRTVVPGKPAIIALTATSGERTSAPTWDEWHVPKRDLITAFLLALQQRRFQGAASLPLLNVLIQEAKDFQWKVGTTKIDDLYGQWKNGKHDDLLRATSDAVWWGEKYAPTTLPSQGTQYATAPGNPLARRVGVARGRREA